MNTHGRAPLAVAALAALAAVTILSAMKESAHAAVITAIPPVNRDVALTFDACEADAPAHLDHGIADYLVRNRIPFTVFMAGKFARANAADARWLATFPFVDIENHSFSHFDHMERMTPSAVQAEVVNAQVEIQSITGRITSFFRFPAGNYSLSGLAAVEALGYRVVHWRWPVGDPDPKITAARIERAVASAIRPGDILIMHINGRGWHTAEALPTVVAELKARGFRFVTIAQALGPTRPVLTSEIYASPRT